MSDPRPDRPDPRAAARPGGGPADSLGFLLSRVGAWSSQRFAARLRPLGLDPRHAAIVKVVATTGGVSQQELAERLGVPASRMVALIDTLEALGAVERRRNPDDRRAYLIALTDTGTSLAGRVDAVGAAHDAEVTAPLEPDEAEVLHGLLERLAAAQDLPPDAHPGSFGAPPRGAPPQTGRPPGRRSGRAARSDR